MCLKKSKDFDQFITYLGNIPRCLKQERFVKNLICCIHFIKESVLKEDSTNIPKKTSLNTKAKDFIDKKQAKVRIFVKRNCSSHVWFQSHRTDVVWYCISKRIENAFSIRIENAIYNDVLQENHCSNDSEHFITASQCICC